MIAKIRFASFVSGALVSTLVGCGSSGRAVEETSEAGTPPSQASTIEAPSARETIAQLASLGPFAAHVGRGARLAREHDGWALEAGGGPLGRSLHATLPSHAGAPLRIDGTRVANGWIEVRAPAWRDVPAVAVEGAVVENDVAEATDVVWVAEPGRVEEIRVLRAASAATRARYVLRAGEGIAELRLAGALGDRVEGVSADGAVVVTTEPMFAVDRDGKRLAVRATVASSASATSGAREWTLDLDVDASGAAYPIAIDPAWTAGPTMSEGRRNHTATALLSGGVLVVGGNITGVTGVTTSEIYDPTTNTFGNLSNLQNPRFNHAAQRLASGDVVIFGGSARFSGSGGSMYIASTAELYNHNTNTWANTGSMTVPRTYLTSVVLPTGKVLAIGGWNYTTSDVFYASVDSYDPSTGLWTAAKPMLAARAWATATVLPSGKVLIVGGRNNPLSQTGVALTTTEIYDPVNGPVAGPTVAGGELLHAAISLTDGSVLVTGGTGAPRLFNSTASSSVATGGTFTTRNQPVLARLPSGLVLAAGGDDIYGPSTLAELFDPSTVAWFSASPMATGRRTAAGSILPNGGVIVTGGDYVNAPGVTDRSATSEIYLPLSNGAACARDGDCLSKLCVDGYCCNSACTGNCSACDVAGSLGVCTSVTGPVHTSGPPRTCGQYTCVAGACATSCTSDAQCVSADFCQAGVCVPKLGFGIACTGSNQCQYGNCVDGYCCESACTGQCQACDVPGNLGVCYVVTGPPHGARAACAGSSGPAACAPACDGTDVNACHFPGTSKACGTDACVASTETHAGQCDGTGGCTSTTSSCGAYACDATPGANHCLTTCAATRDCAAGNYCKAGACIRAEDLGTACTEGAQCATGYCVDGVCCGVSSCATGSSCAYGGSTQCLSDLGRSCTSDSTCGSGHCVDGVCCDTACNGQCEACNVSGGEGVCTAVQGTPVGARPACDDGGANVCAAKACDGIPSHRDRCAGFVRGAAATCAPPSCANASFTASSSCDGAGTCVAPATTSCVPFNCDANGCLTSCQADGDCAPGFGCSSGACVAVGAVCSSDLSASVSASGNTSFCAPYLCSQAGANKGQCNQSCDDSSQCVPSASCDTASHQCVAQSGAAGQSSGGCAIGDAVGGDPTKDLAALAGAIALVAARRRRRARSLKGA